MDEIINNQRSSSDRYELGYELGNNDEDSCPITPIHEMSTRIFTDVLKSHIKEKENRKSDQQSS